MIRRKIKLKVYSKINLSLNILGVKDNLHTLDMIITSVNLADVITVCERSDDKINIEFTSSSDIILPSEISFTNDNSAMRAAEVLRREFGDFGADIIISKSVPISGGMGGSSVDAAGVMLALDLLFDYSSRGFEPCLAGSKVGSDVPFFLNGGLVRVGGSGNEIKKIHSPSTFFFVICNSGKGVSSKDSYKKFDEINKNKKLILSDNDALENALISGDNSLIFAEIDNALTKASTALEPSINLSLRALENTKAVKSFMTGSGSVCVGIFENESDSIVAEAELKKQGFYAKALKSVKNGVEILEKNF